MKHFALITNKIKDKEGIVAKQVKETLESISPEVTVTFIDGEEKQPVFDEKVECVFALGGDGTMLNAAQKVVKKRLPIIGINLGTMGYLSEVELVSLKESMEALVENQFTKEDRMMLACVLPGKEGEDALNDVVLSRRGEVQLIGYQVVVNGKYLSDFYADGIIISTPTGSTGYNLSAGGPIVEPSAKLMVLTPVCPHTLNTRSIILSPQDVITLKVLPSRGEKEAEVAVSLDGREGRALYAGDEVTISMSKNVTTIIKIKDAGFLDVLHRKMGMN